MTERSSAMRYSERTKRRARHLYAACHWSKARISRELDVEIQTLRTWLVDLGDPQPRLFNQRRYDRAAILADAKQLTRAELRTKYGCSQRFLSHLLNGKLKP